MDYTNKKILYVLNDKVRDTLKSKLLTYQSDNECLSDTTLLKRAYKDIGLHWNYVYRILRNNQPLKVKATHKLANFTGLSLDNFEKLEQTIQLNRVITVKAKENNNAK